MKHLKSFEKIKIGDYVKIASWFWSNNDYIQIISDEIYEIAYIDKRGPYYAIKNQNNEIVDWLNESDLRKISKFDKEKIKYNL